MQEAIARAEAKKLRDRHGVESVEIKQNSKGVYIEATPTNQYRKGELEAELHNFSVWVEVTDPQESD